MISWIINAVLGLLVLMSIITWSIGVIKYRRLRRCESDSAQFVETFFVARTDNERLKLAKTNDSEFARLAAAGLSEMNDARAHGLDAHEEREAVERKLVQMGHEILSIHESGLSELGTIGTLSPFVGLFGTVWGIMDALKTISASGNATIETVSGPVGEALITTAIGILTAIPAAAFFNYFTRQVKLRAVKMDEFGERMMKVVSHRSATGK